jgi:hypothetical protein
MPPAPHPIQSRAAAVLPASSSGRPGTSTPGANTPANGDDRPRPGDRSGRDAGGAVPGEVLRHVGTCRLPPPRDAVGRCPYHGHRALAVGVVADGDEAAAGGGHRVHRLVGRTGESSQAERHGAPVAAVGAEPRHAVGVAARRNRPDSHGATCAYREAFDPSAGLQRADHSRPRQPVRREPHRRQGAVGAGGDESERSAGHGGQALISRAAGGHGGHRPGGAVL